MHEYYYWSIQENKHCNNDNSSADVIINALRSKSFCSHFNRLGGLSNFFLDDIWYIIIQFSLTVLVFLNCSEIRDAFWHFDRLGGVRIKFGSWFILSIAPVPVFCWCDVRAFYGHVIQQLQRLLSFPPPQSVHHRWLMVVVMSSRPSRDIGQRWQLFKKTRWASASRAADCRWQLFKKGRDADVSRSYEVIVSLF